MRKKVLMYCVMALVSLIAMSIVALASTGSVCMEKEALNIEERADDIGYQFKVINNVLYRRLYNFSTGEALTDWEVAP